ncbi:MAG: ROK family protein, partial [Hominenteromicrobium sp.]
ICREWIDAGASAEAVGIAFPSLVDVRRKQILGHNNKFADYARIDLKQWVWDRFRLPMVIENDANAAALGEGRYGSAADSGDFVLMILGTGIGTAAVMNGQLVRGRHYQAGNLFGHIPLKADGRKCVGCPGVGCAEAQASSWALPYMVRESGLDSPLKSEENVDFRVLQQYYDRGDPLAVSIFDECCTYWANCLITLIHAYDPEVAVLSGGVLNWGPALTERIVHIVEERAWTPWGRIAFRRAKNPEHSVLLGLHALCETDLLNL